MALPAMCLFDDFQTGATFGFRRGNCRRDDIGDVLVSVFCRMVTLVFLLFVKLPVLIEVAAGAKGA